MMGRIVTIFLLMFSVTLCVSAQETLTSENNSSDTIWEPTFKSALEKAAKENLPVLIYFTGSDWCGPCINLDEKLFHTEKFETFAKGKMIGYIADFPRNSDLVSTENKKINNELREKYDQSSFPTMIMINKKGKVLGRKNGAYLPEYYYPFFDNIAKKF